MFEFPFRLQNLYLVKSEQFVTFEITLPFYGKFIFFKSYICESESSMFSIQSHCCIKDMKEMSFLFCFFLTDRRSAMKGWSKQKESHSASFLLSIFLH